MAWKRTNASGDESSVYVAALDRLTGPTSRDGAKRPMKKPRR
jgi:hypothetical protein